MDSVDSGSGCIFSGSVNFPKRQILESSKLKVFPDDNFKFNENGRRLTKWVENTIRKGEIACYEPFLLLPQCFRKTCTAYMYKQGLVSERVKRVKKVLNNIL